MNICQGSRPDWWPVFVIEGVSLYGMSPMTFPSTTSSARGSLPSLGGNFVLFAGLWERQNAGAVNAGEGGSPGALCERRLACQDATSARLLQSRGEQSSHHHPSLDRHKQRTALHLHGRSMITIQQVKRGPIAISKTILLRQVTAPSTGPR